MNKSIKKLLITVSAVGALLFPVLTPAFAGAAGPVANIASGICGGANLSIAPETCAPSSSTDNTLTNTIKLIVDLLTLFVGFMAVLGFTFGAYYAVLSSSGTGGKALASKARNAVLYSLLGLIIAVVAQVIVYLVIGKARQTIVL